MYFCSICNSKVKDHDVVCPECGGSLEHIHKSHKNETNETYEVCPRFVFVYELLPSSLKTVWLLFVLFITANLVREYFHLPPAGIIVLFAFLLLLKDLKLFFRKFRYRNVKYIISDEGIEYSDMSRNQTSYFISYDNIKAVEIDRNFATILFGYGHILVKDTTSGIYLDYIANVEKVYDYICNQTRK